MRRISWEWPTAAAIIGAAFVVGSKLRRFVPESTKRIVWKDPDAPRRIRIHADRIERVTGWTGLGDYLVAVAYIESRGNSQAGGDTGNLARGWGGMRPVSSRATELGLDPAVALKREADSIALSAWYAYRLRKFASEGQNIDFLALRRGWALPKLVPDTGNPGYWKQLSMGYKAAGVPASKMLEPAFPAGFRWPGADAVLQASRGAIA